MIDYAELLRKYIRYVVDREGTDFISPTYHGYTGDETFTPEQWAELNRISENEFRPPPPR